MIFPHAKSDWAAYLGEAEATFVAIISAITRYEPVLLICHDIDYVKGFFDDEIAITYVAYESDDTWARDCSAITVREADTLKLLNFRFNAWGGKFAHARDNALSETLQGIYDAPMQHESYILEGGAIEFDTKGTMLTNAQTLLNENRNHLSKGEHEAYLKEVFGLKKILWLDDGFLRGDDTDSHIDTLARFVDDETIMYVTCIDKEDEHYSALSKMKRQLEGFRNYKNEPYKLIPLELPEAIYHEGERLPATYANFLIINGAVIVPTYGDALDSSILERFKAAFVDREIVGVDCRTLIKQGGSLHCVTMQFATTLR